MNCPYCGDDLTLIVQKYWSGEDGECFEIICPSCANNVVVAASLSFDIHKHEDEDMNDEI